MADLRDNNNNSSRSNNINYYHSNDSLFILVFVTLQLCNGQAPYIRQIRGSVPWSVVLKKIVQPRLEVNCFISALNVSLQELGLSSFSTTFHVINFEVKQHS